jgi:hypothetical protein
MIYQEYLLGEIVKITIVRLVDIESAIIIELNNSAKFQRLYLPVRSRKCSVKVAFGRFSGGSCRAAVQGEPRVTVLGRCSAFAVACSAAALTLLRLPHVVTRPLEVNALIHAFSDD